MIHMMSYAGRLAEPSRPRACPVARSRASRSVVPSLVLVALGTIFASVAAVAQEEPAGSNERYPLPYPPSLPGGKEIVTERSAEFLKPPEVLREGVVVAKEPPRVDFLYYPGQDYPGKPWSCWGDGCAAGDKYYSAIGDHHSPRGRPLLFEYDATRKELRLLVDVRKFLESSGTLPDDMDYLPGKVHGRIDLGKDGWLYYATHRGSPRTTNDEHGYRGDWVLRTHPASGKTEIVASFPVEKHAIPMSVLDPGRMIFYGGTAHGADAPIQDVVFFAWDLRRGRRILSVPGGPKRCAILASSTGRLFWDGKVFDPANPAALGRCEAAPSVRSATRETPQGIVYGTTERSADLWAFHVEKESLTPLGSGAVGEEEYVTTIDADPSGRYLYYIPGAHGGTAADGTPVVQFDVQRKKRKVIAFLNPYFFDRYGYTLDGTFSSALDPKGEKLYVTWNGMRKGQPRFWECCALTVIHIPASERP